MREPVIASPANAGQQLPSFTHASTALIFVAVALLICSLIRGPHATCTLFHQPPFIHQLDNFFTHFSIQPPTFSFNSYNRNQKNSGKNTTFFTSFFEFKTLFNKKIEFWDRKRKKKEIGKKKTSFEIAAMDENVQSTWQYLSNSNVPFISNLTLDYATNLSQWFYS